MNIYDISEKAGVSIATVSRVLNGSNKVRPATREKILAVMEENGYTPNAFARGLGLNSMHTIGIMCADSSDPYLAQAIYYLERELRKNEYASMLCCTGYRLEEKKEYLNLLLSKKVDALFFVGSNFIEESQAANEYLFQAAKSMPIVFLNGHLSGKNIYSVLCDDYQATYDVTDLILKTNVKKPLYLYRMKSYSGKRKMQGFQDACIKNGLSFETDWFRSCPGSIEKTRQFLTSLKNHNIFFDAVIAADDELAVGAVKYAQQQSLLIPDQFQVAGYNNSVLSICSTPEITSVDNRVEYMCTMAVSLLMHVFEKKDFPSKNIFSGMTIERQTTLSKM